MGIGKESTLPRFLLFPILSDSTVVSRGKPCVLWSLPLFAAANNEQPRLGMLWASEVYKRQANTTSSEVYSFTPRAVRRAQRPPLQAPVGLLQPVRQIVHLQKRRRRKGRKRRKTHRPRASRAGHPRRRPWPPSSPTRGARTWDEAGSLELAPLAPLAPPVQETLRVLQDLSPPPARPPRSRSRSAHLPGASLRHGSACRMSSGAASASMPRWHARVVASCACVTRASARLRSRHGHTIPLRRPAAPRCSGPPPPPLSGAAPRAPLRTPWTR